MCKSMQLALLLLLSMFYEVSTAEDWPQLRGPHRNNISKETGLLRSWRPGGPRLLWTFRQAGLGYSGMSVVGQRLYSCGGDGVTEHLYAVDLKSQKRIWTVKIGEFRRHASGESDGPCSTPTIEGRFVYVLGGCGRLLCVDSVSGEVIWSRELQGELSRGGATHYGYIESPLVDGEQVVATPGGEAGAIAAFDKRTGTLKWRCAGHRDMVRCGSLIVMEAGGVRQYVQATQTHVVGVRAADGLLLWRVARGQAGVIAQQNGCILICAESGALIKLRHSNESFRVEEIYSKSKLRAGQGSALLRGEYLYSAEGAWMCQNFLTGKIVWRKRCDLGGVCAVSFADGCIYAYWASKGDVQLIQPTPGGFKETGIFRVPAESQTRKSRPVCDKVHPGEIWPAPVVANGKLYLRDHDVIFCYDIAAPGVQK